MFEKLIGLVILPILFVGCASTQPMAVLERANVTAVMLNKDVSVPAKMSYLGPGGAAGLAFGAVGAVMAAPAIEKDRASFQEQTATNSMSIDRIVYGESLA